MSGDGLTTSRQLRRRAKLLAKLYRDNLDPGEFMTAYRPDFHFHGRGLPRYVELFQAWNEGHLFNNVGDLPRFYLLYLNALQVLKESIPGAFVELGVYRGNSAKLLSMVARTDDRPLYLFDTFSGFDAHDSSAINGDLGALSFADTSLEYVKKFVADDRAIYVKGFFPDSLAYVKLPPSIALVHIDCDLYEPMRAGLEHFYPLMSPGGMMILHDYASGAWPGVTKAVDEFFDGKPEAPVIMPDKSGTAIVRRAKGVA